MMSENSTLFNPSTQLLLSSEQWQMQEALRHLQTQVRKSFATLSDEQQREYVVLERAALKALKDVENESARITNTFKKQGLARLIEALKTATGLTLNPEKMFISTRYGEVIERPSLWAVTKKNLGIGRRRRALDESRFKLHVSTMSVWRAACLNFGYTTSYADVTGFSYETASTLKGENAEHLSIKTFIRISRELDLGQQLKREIEASLSAGGTLRTLIDDAAKVCIKFELLEALRDSSNSGLTEPLYGRYKKALEQGQAQITLTSNEAGGGSYYPLFLVQLADESTHLSYFPQRRGGAFVLHHSFAESLQTFKALLKQSYQQEDMGWFTSQLSPAQLSAFEKLRSVSKTQDPQRFLLAQAMQYEPVRYEFTDQSFERMRITGQPLESRSPHLAAVVSTHQAGRYREALSLLASTRSEADWNAFKTHAIQVGGEVLELLTLPLPGGVLGLNRIMQTALFGSLGYSLVSGGIALTKGQHAEFASALADCLDLVISLRLSLTASRLHSQRMRELWHKLDKPQRVMREDGQQELWTPTIEPYEKVDVLLLDGLTPNDQGIYQVGEYSYVKLSTEEQQVAIQVVYDDKRKAFTLVASNPALYCPCVAFDVNVQRWHLQVENIHTLSDIDLLQRMLPTNSKPFSSTQLTKMLKSTGITHDVLKKVWDGQPAPAHLLEGVRRLHIDKVIEHLTDDFTQQDQMPHLMHEVVFGLLTQLDSWPDHSTLNVWDADGGLIESYTRKGDIHGLPTVVSIKRQADGTYTALDDHGLGETTSDPLFRVILRQLPDSSLLGREDNKNRSESARIAVIREHIATLARAERITLHDTLYNLEGLTRDHPWAINSESGKFLPNQRAVDNSPFSQTLNSFRMFFSGLSEVGAREILRNHPLSEADSTALRQQLKLPNQYFSLAQKYLETEQVNRAIDSIYHPRRYNQEYDIWARTFAAQQLDIKLDRSLIITQRSQEELYKPYQRMGADDRTIALEHLGDERYQVAPPHSSTLQAVPDNTDSFYLAISDVLTPEERTLMGMGSPADINGLRTTLGNAASAQRLPSGESHLDQAPLLAYESNVILPAGLRPDALGIYQVDGKQYLPLDGRIFQVEYDTAEKRFKLKHPRGEQENQPVLEHNSAGAWRRVTEEPLVWPVTKLFRRLSNQLYNFSNEVISHVLAITGVRASALRYVHRNNLTAPVYLLDTCKRFKVLDDIDVFIEQMRYYPSGTQQDSNIQLWGLTNIPGFFAQTQLNIVDAQGRVVGTYGESESAALSAISLTREEMDGPDFLTLIVERSNAQHMENVLGETGLTIEQQIVKLARKIADAVESTKFKLFERLYRQREFSHDPDISALAAKYPQLPVSVIECMLKQTTQLERQTLKEGVVPFRVAEHIDWVQKEVELNRALEGLYKDTLASAESTHLLLHEVVSQPGWPEDTRLDVFENNVTETPLLSVGNTHSDQRKILLKKGSHYFACNEQGDILNQLPQQGDNLLESVWALLNPAERKTMKVDSKDQLPEFKQALVTNAAEKRDISKAVLGKKVLPQWLSSPLNVDISFIAYPSSIRGFFSRVANWVHPSEQLQKTMALYPSFSIEQANSFMQSLNLSGPQLIVELERRRVEYDTLVAQLNAWRDSARGPRTIFTRNDRVRMKEEILKAWRRETVVFFDDTGVELGYTLRLECTQYAEIPTFLSGDFNHVASLEISRPSLPETLQVDRTEDYERFLRLFSNLKILTIDHAHLSRIPTSIGDMRELRYLDLADGGIPIDQASMNSLMGLSHLEYLVLQGNHLNVTPDIRPLQHLAHLNLRATGIESWPIGAETQTGLQHLDLRENRLQSIPASLFNNPDMMRTNRATYLHGNPFNAISLSRLAEFRRVDSFELGGRLPGTTHQAMTDSPVERWLSGIPITEVNDWRHTWFNLRIEEAATPSSSDLLRLLNDLTWSADYTHSSESRIALTQRVRRLLLAISRSTELRAEVYRKAYGEGTCGDGAILMFNKLEVLGQIAATSVLADQNAAEKDLLRLAEGLFFLSNVDRLAERKAYQLLQQNSSVDTIEVVLYYRIKLKKAFNLPLQPDKMLFDSLVERYDPNIKGDIEQAQIELEKLRKSRVLQTYILSRSFWHRFLERKYSAQFKAIASDAQRKTAEVKRLHPDPQSDEYFDALQAVIDEKDAALRDLIEQLTLNARHSTAAV
ncbi:NEL-type E3 ubiquitin ligase domain-containing protein [Pseudomonas mucidolens]|uniref:NEL-type E3 ubiquitin ligase domain-containing protein n=1 Tax=Pseudomonas mucidolens TaxID=46679 RepID=UPI001032A01C|nr:NEL-type E3 ubiquitin ligase domain-containing protein [Pseudomonas mucidolens]